MRSNGCVQALSIAILAEHHLESSHRVHYLLSSALPEELVAKGDWCGDVTEVPLFYCLLSHGGSEVSGIW